MHSLGTLGVKSVFVGSGDASVIEDFSKRQNLEDKQVTILSDPSLQVFALAGLQRSAWSTYGLPAMAGAIRAMGRGYENKRRAGDGTQQGGLLVMDEDGVVRFCYRNQHLADRADANDVMQIAISMAAEGLDPDSGLV